MPTEAQPKTNHDLFIVDNSEEGWNGIRYLKDWCDLSKSFDIATGYFEIGSLLALDGEWQKLEKIRILMGSEMTSRTGQVLTKSQRLQQVRDKAVEALDASIDEDKGKNPFLSGIPSILAALESGQIECRIYNRDKFHAKTYITHSKHEVVGSKALVGSSNFTKPGLMQNVELNVQVQSGNEVNLLQEWFDKYWELGEEVTSDIIDVIERHTQEFRPYDVYTQGLHMLLQGHALTADEWDQTESKMFPVLDGYQQEGYHALLNIAHRHGGAFLCDGVGLGKTFVGMMLIERLCIHENKRVALFAPKSAVDGVWEPHIKEWLPHVGGVGSMSEYSNLYVFSHTDLSKKDAGERFSRIAELVDVVIIDEAHHFRIRGREPKEGVWIDGTRYRKMYELLNQESRKKQIYMLTATPVNNRLHDFRR